MIKSVGDKHEVRFEYRSIFPSFAEAECAERALICRLTGWPSPRRST